MRMSIIVSVFELVRCWLENLGWWQFYNTMTCMLGLQTLYLLETWITYTTRGWSSMELLKLLRVSSLLLGSFVLWLFTLIHLFLYKLYFRFPRHQKRFCGMGDNCAVIRFQMPRGTLLGVLGVGKPSCGILVFGLVCTFVFVWCAVLALSLFKEDYSGALRIHSGAHQPCVS